ncbi:hypothetical protein [Actinomadura madurae]|uniref:hypothetical protein n=1 Tax=Actinomadura madurae TaxID=1993 RepID=UPI0015EED16B|nr:hypothetical protein [Actinomadura madurae]
MAVSYITLLTAFDGPRLPLWKLLPPITFWFLPAAIGRCCFGRCCFGRCPRR